MNSRKLIPRALGALTGIALAGFLVASARPSSELPSLAAQVSVSVPFSGELEPDPAAPRSALDSVSLRPEGSRASAYFDLRNQTGENLSVGFRADVADSGLDGLLRIRLSSHGAVLANTTLQGLRTGTEAALTLGSGESAKVELKAWIPAGVESGYESRHAYISLVPEIGKVER